MNLVNLIGNICNDLELKSTQGGKFVTSFNLAVRRPYAKDTTDFIPIVCWNKNAENICKFCEKGSKIAVQGMLTTRKFEDKEGKNRIAYEVIANDVMFLDSKANKQTLPTDKDGFVAMADDSECPF